MILRCFCWSIFLCLAFGVTVKAQVTVDDEGYQNLLIAIDQNVDFSKGKETIEKTQELIRSTSSVLHKAIGIRIASATFLLPPYWSTEKWKDITVTNATQAQTARKVDIRVDATKDSPFGQLPSALQYGGCGVTGHRITLPLDFLASTDGYPKAKLLAREWLKYRYGVFDENGFPKDRFYPDYYTIPGGSDIRFTECTNSKVTYKFTKPYNDDVCNMESLPNFGYCRTRPDEKSIASVTSSLMYYHKELPNMEHICGKDGRPHNSLAQNKHNVLCNGQSIWNVVKSSADFKNIRRQSANPDTGSIKFSYIQESKPRLVVLLENSDKLHEQQSAIKFALRRLYYDLPADSKLALYTFNSDVTEALSYSELPGYGRKDLGTIADFGYPASSICASCGVAKAAQTLLEKSEVEGGSILLITSSPLDKTPALSEKLKECGICLHVRRFTDKGNTVDQTYDPLAKSFYCFTQETLDINSDVVDVFNNLFRFLKNPVLKFNDELVIKTVASGNMSAPTLLTIPQDKAALLYRVWLGRALGKDSIDCRVGNTVVGLETETTATDIASFTFDAQSKDVTCRLTSAKQVPLLAEAQVIREQDFDFDVWIHDHSTVTGQRPIIIYAKLYFGAYPIKSANVTTVVKSLNNPSQVVTMLDNGGGDPDVTKYDGIYSGYFANFLEAGIHEFSVKINDNKGSAKIGKQDPSLSPAPCCGHEVVSKDHDVPAFEMEKHVVFLAFNKSPKDGYPPSRIVDLVAIKFKDTVTFIWTAPGGGKAARYVMKVFKSRQDAVEKFDTTGIELDASKMKSSREPRDTGTPIRLDVYLKDFEEGATNHVAIRTFSASQKPSEVSNVVEFLNPKPVETTSERDHETSTDPGITNQDPPSSGNNTVAIVLGVLGGFAVLIALALLGHYYFVKKPRRS